MCNTNTGICRCKTWLSGKNCEIECNNHGFYYEDAGKCICTDRVHTGDNCDKICNNHGAPDPKIGGLCKCDSEKGWIGIKCESECNGRGIWQKCLNKDNTFYHCCQCDPDYTGKYCEIKK